MCGLIGEWRWRPPATPQALSLLAHRGPDGHGDWRSPDGRCWLGHTRLAIQDRSAAGAQPIHSHCGRFSLVFNGEIYNHLSLRSSLPPLPWRGHSDSETLVEGLAHSGLTLLRQLRGMYAFAAYDHLQGELWLSRDPLGIKPLYIARRQGVIRFASERRALGWPTPLAPAQISQLLAWGHLSTPLALPNGEDDFWSSLPAGGLLRLQADATTPLNLTAHPGPFSGGPAGASTTPARRVRTTLEQVVADHLLADVPVACFLSAGLDSGILTALACRASPGRISTFTVAFPDRSIDEGDRAEAMARHCGSDHHTLTLSDSQTIHWVEEGLQALDVPTADGLNTYVISRAVAAQGIRVALSGLGADELFGGYPAHRLVPWLHRLRGLPRPLRIALLTRLAPRLGRKVADIEQWSVWQLSLALRRWAGERDLRAAGAVPLPWPLPPHALPRRRWTTISSAELCGYTEPMLLRDSDVLSMACGLEVRVPFLDQRLVHLLEALPDSSLRPGKTLLREACADLFPAGHLARPKQGFTLPMAAWMQGPLGPLCRERLAALTRSRWLDPTWIAQQWQQFEAGRLHWTRAWTLVVLGEFAAREAASGSVGPGIVP